jgi:hypothetical protein
MTDGHVSVRATILQRRRRQNLAAMKAAYSQAIRRRQRRKGFKAARAAPSWKVTLKG